jgi:hypothetical protein
MTLIQVLTSHDLTHGPAELRPAVHQPSLLYKGRMDAKIKIASLLQNFYLLRAKFTNDIILGEISSFLFCVTLIVYQI